MPRSALRLGTQLWQWLVLLALKGASAPLQSLPAPAAARLGTVLGSLAYWTARRQRRRSLANLRLAYDDRLSLAQRGYMTRRVFQHFGRGLVDFLRAPVRSPADLSRLVSCEGWEHVEDARERGRGVLLVSGHLGNWEVLGRWLATVKRLSLTVVAREPESEALGAYVRALREGAGFTVLSKGASARGLLSALRRGEAVLMLADQNSGDVFAPFFGVPSGTAAGPATLALRSGAALVPIYCVECPAADHPFRVICHAPLATGSEGAGGLDRGTRADTVVGITTELNAVLEGMIRRYPDQWLWLHNRWKSAFAERNRDRAWTAWGLTRHDLGVARDRWTDGG